MGWDPSAFEDGKFTAILDGHLPPNGTDLSLPVSSRSTPGWIHQPREDQRVHAVVYFVTATNAQDRDQMERVKQWLALARNRDLGFLIFLSKADESDEFLRADNGLNLDKLFRSKKVNDVCNLISNRTGLSRSWVIPIISYTYHMDVNCVVDCICLYALYRVLNTVSDYFGRLALEKNTAHTYQPPVSPYGHQHQQPNPDVNFLTFRQQQYYFSLIAQGVNPSKAFEEAQSSPV